MVAVLSVCEYTGFYSISPEAQAGWAQAVFSALAILAAGAFPYWHQALDARRKKRQVARTLLALAVNVQDMGEDVYEGVRTSAARTGAALFGVPDHYDALLGALAGYPTYTLEGITELYAFTDLRRTAAQLDKVWRAVVKHGDGDEGEVGPWDDLVEAGEHAYASSRVLAKRFSDALFDLEHPWKLRWSAIKARLKMAGD